VDFLPCFAVVYKLNNQFNSTKVYHSHIRFIVTRFPHNMRFTLLAPLLFALPSLAIPLTPDCESLRSLAILHGAKIFCAENYPAPANVAIVPVAGAHKNNAKRFQQDDERVVHVLGRMPESRQKAFCACYPAAKEEGGEGY
jgi:hypothetical protein